jgi:diguanylate cyclase (GGDEF)-like protein
MATILIVDDRAANREFLVTLLGYHRHRLLEASDGERALAFVRAEHPDLVISDILMPTMDGYEFVRRLRADPALAATPVIFYTAHYHGEEAEKLARDCGVSYVLTKPCEPELVLQTVAQALGQSKPPVPTPTPGFDREHLRILTDKLLDQVNKLRRTNERFAALNNINLQLASERDPRQLLDSVCNAARDLTAAKYALLAVGDDEGTATNEFTTSGLGAKTVARIGYPVLREGPVRAAVRQGKPLRVTNPGGDPAAVGLWLEHLPVYSLLVAPIVSLTRNYGWIALADKLGAKEFSTEDELLVAALGALLGRIYENGNLYAEARRHAAVLERLNRVHAVLSGINALIVRERDRDQLFSEACRIAVDDGQFRLAWIGVVDREKRQVRAVAWRGAGEDYIQLMPLGLDESAAETFGLAGRVVTERKAMVSQDMVSDPRVSLSKEALRRGFRSLAILPLLTSGEVVAVLALYVGEPEFFDAEEMKLLLKLAGDIAFALDHIAKEEKLDYLAYYDTLTGLANPTLFHERLTQIVGRAASEGRKFAVVLLDIHDFKTINDSHGRQAGDDLLKELAARLARGSGNAAAIGRISGDRFGAILQDVKHETDVTRELDELHSLGFGSSFLVDGNELNIAAKSGVAVYPSDGTDADTLLRNAEVALRKAKSTGEKRVFYTQEMTQIIANRITLENRLRQALEREEFVLHYQPKVDLESRQIQGVEALMRWQSPDLGLVPPLRFISVLEETGMILEAGAWALRRAVLDHRDWLRQNLMAPRVAVNVSAIQLRQPDFIDVFRDVLRQGAKQPGIDVEITESLIMDDVAGTVDKLKTLRSLGVGIAIDDFGTGYSSLGYLARLPVHSLKIDRSFINTMMDNPNTMTLVSMIISLAHSLRLKVCAEGVETEEQAKALRLLRCDEMQGYLISRPVPLDKLTPLLLSQSA